MKKKVFLVLSLISLTAYGKNLENIKLDKSVIYSATGFLSEMRKVAATPTVITSDEIKNKHYKSVTEVLEHVPSVSITHTAEGSVIDLRGQGSSIARRNVQILIDGVPVNALDTSHNNYLTNSINVDSIERIEVIPGGGSVLYGSGTQGGVISIMTKEGRGTRGSVSYERSSYSGNRYNISAGETIGKFDIDMFTNLENGYGYREGNQKDNKFFMGKIKYNINDNDNLEFKYSYFKGEQLKSSGITKKVLEEDRRAMGLDSRKKAIELKENNSKKEDYVLTYNSKVNDNVEINLTGFYEDSRSTRGNKIGAKKTPTIFDDTKIGFRPKLKYSYGEGITEGSSFVTGFDYIHNKAQRISSNKKTDIKKETFAGFFMNNSKLNNFEFNQGIRYETSTYNANKDESSSNIKNKKIDNFAYELSGSYLYSETGKIYTRLERGFTSPPPALLTNKYNSKYEINNLKSESYQNIEFGISDYIFDNTTINGTVFYTLTKNEIQTNRHGGFSKIINYNIDETERLGAELSLTHYFDKLTLTESYEYLRGKIKSGHQAEYDRRGNIEKGINIGGRRIKGVPTHKFILGAKYDFTNNFNINGELIYKGNAYIENTNKAGKDNGSTVFNMRAGYSFDNGIEIYGGINNLFNDKYYEDITYSEKRGKKTYLYTPAEERTYYAGVSIIL